MKKFLYKICPVKRSAEDPSKVYICLFGRRYTFQNGKYIGWHKA